MSVSNDIVEDRLKIRNRELLTEILKNPGERGLRQERFILIDKLKRWQKTNVVLLF
jgi:hypothetical protein